MKRLNINEFIWFVILLGFTFYIYNLLSTGKIYFFIHPKMSGQVGLSLYGFAVLTLFQTKRIFNKSAHTGIRLGYIIFLVPLVLGFTVDPQVVSIDVAAQKGVIIAGTGSFKCTDHKHESHLIRYYSEEGDIVVDQNNFVSKIVDICSDIECNRGKNITISGFIYRDDSFKENEFLISRILVSCCAADAQVTGIMCRTKTGRIPVVGQWVRVEGRLNSIKYTERYSGLEYTIPQIIVDKIEGIKNPENKYIYY